MKKIGVLFIIGLLLCSGLVAAGFWDRLTGAQTLADRLKDLLGGSKIEPQTEKVSQMYVPEGAVPIIGCGNGVCDYPTENNENCYQDCTINCGNNYCDFADEVISCPVDCWGCGDGFCKDVGDPGMDPTVETSQNCPEDCGPIPQSTCVVLNYNDFSDDLGQSGNYICHGNGLKTCKWVLYSYNNHFMDSTDGSCVGVTQIATSSYSFKDCNTVLQNSNWNCDDQEYSDAASWGEPMYGDVNTAFGPYQILCC